MSLPYSKKDLHTLAQAFGGDAPVSADHPTPRGVRKREPVKVRHHNRVIPDLIRNLFTRHSGVLVRNLYNKTLARFYRSRIALRLSGMTRIFRHSGVTLFLRHSGVVSRNLYNKTLGRFYRSRIALRLSGMTKKYIPAPFRRRLRSPRVQLALRVAVLILAVGLGIRTYMAIRDTQAVWYDSAWEFRKRIVVNKDLVEGSSSFTNFPILIQVTDREIIAGSQTDGDDILFALPNGTKLDHELEKIDPASDRITAWVEIPTLKHNEDTILYVYYGNPAATAQGNPTGVWDGDSKAVWHFSESSGLHQDSTSVGIGSSAVVVSSQGTALGVAGGADTFDGINDFIGIGHTAPLHSPNSLTVEGWVKMDSTFNKNSPNIQGVVDKGGYQIFMDKSDGKAKFVVNDAAADAFATMGNGFNNYVEALTVWNGDLYAGGWFTGPGSGGTCTDCNRIAKWDGVSWSTVGNGFNAIVYTLTVWNGDLYAGGTFTSAGSGGTCTDCNRIAKWNGSSWSGVANGLSGTVNALTVWNGDLYAGGGFSSVCGNSACNSGNTVANRIAKWNGSSWSTVENGVNTTVYAFTVWNGDLVVGGLFGSICGNSACNSGNTVANRIAKWNGSSWSTVGNGFNSTVQALTVWNGDLYAGGTFTGPGSGGTCTGCNRIAKWNGSSWSTVGNGFNNIVYALTVWNGDLYAGGIFTSAGSGGTCTDCNRIAKWDGVSWSTVGNGFSAAVYALTVWNGDLYAGGIFTGPGSGGTCTDCNQIAKWGTANTTSVSSATASWTAGSWYHLAGVFDGSNLKMYVNGNLETTSATSMTAIEDTSHALVIGKTHGSQVTGGNGEWLKGAIDEVRISSTARSADYLKTVFNTIKYPDKPATISTPDGGHWKFDEGAGFTAIDSSGNGNTGHLIGIGTSGPNWTDSGKFNGALMFDGQNDYVGVGDSASLSPTAGITVSSWVKMDSTFSKTSPNIQGVVDKGGYQIFMDKSDGKAKFVVNDAAADAFATMGNGFNASVSTLTVWNGDLYAGGQFTSAGSGGTCTDCNRIAKWDGVSWSTVGNGFDNNVTTLTVWNGDLYAGGVFTGAGSGGTCTDCNSIAKWDGVSWSTVGNGFNNSVSTLTVWNGDLYAGGWFTSAGSGGTCTGCNRIAKWDGVSWSTVGNGFSSFVYALTVWNGDLYAGGLFRSAGSGGTCTNCNYIAKWDGSSWSTVGNGFNSEVRALTVWNGDLYAGGLFRSAGSGGTCTDCNRIAKWDGSSWSTVGNGFNLDVYALTVWNGDLYAGGDFASAGTCTIGCSHIAKWGTANTKSVASSTTTTWTANTWYHIAGVYDGSNLKMYVNGNLETSVATNMTAIEDTTHDLYIGKTHGSQITGGNGELFDGTLDDIRIYRSGKTGNFIQALYTAGTSDIGVTSFLESFGSQETQVGSAVAYWKFDEGTDNTCRDGSSDVCDSMGSEVGSANDGVRSGALWTDESLCLFGKCLYFDGTDDVVTIPNNPSIDLNEGLTGGLTISGWIRPNTTGENGAGEVWRKGDNTYMRVTNAEAGKADLVVSLGLATPATLTVPAGITLNRWTHVAVGWTNDGDDEITVYIDGLPRGTSTNGVGNPADESNDFLIGGGPSNNFKGFIDEFKIFDEQKTDDQMKILFLKGAAGAVSMGVLDTSFLNDGLKGWWKMDEPNPSTCAGGQDYCDSSGNAFHGTATGIGNTAPGRFNYGAPFSGSGSYIDMGDIDL